MIELIFRIVQVTYTEIFISLVDYSVSKTHEIDQINVTEKAKHELHFKKNEFLEYWKNMTFSAC
jgi:hypothetical protein